MDDKQEIYPLLPRQSIQYNVLHSLEVGYMGSSDIETYLRGLGLVVYPRQVSGALQRLKRDGLAAHKNKRERDRWKLTPNAEASGARSVPLE